MKSPAVPVFLALTLLVTPLFREGAKAAPPAPIASAKVSNVSPDDAGKLLAEKGKVTVLDVRTPAEFQKGHIPGATNVDFNAPDFAKKVSELDQSKPVLVHCAAGGRSTKALDALNGFPAVYHLNHGFNAWEKAGKPIEK